MVRVLLLWRLGWHRRSRACKKPVLDQKNSSWTVARRCLRKRRWRNQRVCKQDPLGGCGNAWALARISATAWRPLLCRPCGDNLVPRPDPDGEGAGSPLHDGLEAVVGVVERRDDTAATQPDEGGAQQLGRQLGTGIMPGQGKSRTIQSFLNFFDNFINRKFIFLQKFVGQDNWSTKNCLSWGKSSVFPRLCMEVEEYKR
jgi:hypothetical protein